MMSRILPILALLLISEAAVAQVLSFPSSNPSAITTGSPLNLIQTTIIDSDIFQIDALNRSALEIPSVALSKLDLKAPSKAQKEFNKGYQLMMKKSLQEALVHLTAATTIYPEYVAAHNALGSTYLGLGEGEKARDEFTRAAALDDHLPNSFLNLGCAELALKDYPAAERDIAKAATLAPLDLPLQTAVAYSQYMNHDYTAAIDTARSVHQRKHSSAAMVHYYAAAAWEAQGKFPEAQRELSTMLKEDPKSPAAEAARKSLAQLRDEILHPPASFTAPASSYTLSFNVPIRVPQDPEILQRRQAQDAKEAAQLAEAEAECPNCADTDSSTPTLLAANAAPAAPADFARTKTEQGYTFHAATEEVALFFAATDHGKSVPDLTAKDLTLLDNHKAPAVITGFRNEEQLPLRLAVVVDTSDSINKRFKFEQAAAAEFLSDVVLKQDDLAFVIGFANSVLLTQDFTNDPKAIAHGIDQLVPAGGTALWDAVAYASDKLRSRPETQPVSRILVIISDGEDNSSSATAKQAIHRAQRGEVTVYTVSTRELVDNADKSLVGDHALRTLAGLTGGEEFTPGSAKSLRGALKDLEEVIRSRYFISYKPANFQRNGSYHSIDLSVEKGGRKLHVMARKGYVAAPNTVDDPY